MATVLTREQILQAKDLKVEFVEVPEWATPEAPDAGVYVKGLTGTDRDAFEMAMIEQRRVSTGGKNKTVQSINLKNLRAKLVVRTAVDHPDAELAHEIFTPADIEELGLKNGAALNRLYAKARELSGLSDEDEEELTADLGEGTSDASGSNSPSLLGIAASPNANDGSAVENSPSGESTTDSNPSETEG